MGKRADAGIVVFTAAWVAIVLYLLFASSSIAHSESMVSGVMLDPYTEYRYCGAPMRDSQGTILRNSKVLRDFQKLHPCPSTGLTTGACPKWAKNHSIPLACGGCDAVWNLVWMRNDAKALVDRYERKTNASIPPQPDTAACVNVTQ